MRSDAESQSIPLTSGQKGRLLLECLPPVIFIVIAIFFGTVMSDLISNLTVLFWAIFALIFLVLGYQASKRLRDLFSGVAFVERDRLESAHRTSGGSASGFNRPFYGEFTRLGKMRLIGSVGDQAQAGQNYRVQYSPASRIVWSLEPAD